MSEEKTLGQIAYEAAAAVTACGQPWNEANKAKWEMAANAVLVEAGKRLRVSAELEDIARARRLGSSGVSISPKTIGRREAADSLTRMISQ